MDGKTTDGRTTKEGVLSPSGIPLKAVYDDGDLKRPDEEGLDSPGQYPFTRGLYPLGYRKFSWVTQQVSGFGLAEDTNARQKLLIESGQAHYGGQPNVNIVFDIPTHYGYDCDHPMVTDEVGKCGVSICTLDDMERLFDGLPLENLNTSLLGFGSASVILGMYIALADRRGIPRAQLRGVISNNTLGGFAGTNYHVFPLEATVRLILDIVKFCSVEMPKWNALNLDGYTIRETGANAVQELAFSMSMGLEVVRQLVRQGKNVDDFAPRLGFFFAVHSNFFEEIAKIRAARRLWARFVREEFHARDPKSCHLRLHCDTAGSALTAREPLNNIARVALQALAAVLAGTQGLHTCSYDEVYGLPSDKAVQVAVKTQKIIEHETGVADVVDPLGGSYYVEALTDAMEERALEYIRKIDSMGGYVAAVGRGYIQQEISRSALDYQRKVERGEIVIVGVNKYESDSQADIAPEPYDPGVRDRAVNRLLDYRQRRNPEEVTQALESLRKTAAAPDQNIMPPIIVAVKACATLGEIMGTLKEVFGAPDRKLEQTTCPM